MTDSGFTRTALATDGDERFVSLRRPLKVSGMGMNLILLEPGQRGRVHDHSQQEEVYLVWEGALTLIVEGEPHVLARGELARVGPGVSACVPLRRRRLEVLAQARVEVLVDRRRRVASQKVGAGEAKHCPEQDDPHPTHDRVWAHDGVGLTMASLQCEGRASPRTYGRADCSAGCRSPAGGRRRSDNRVIQGRDDLAGRSPTKCVLLFPAVESSP